MGNTIGDIRARFEMALNERATTIEGILFPSMEKLLGSGRINSKGGGKDLRFDLGGDDKKSIKKIDSAFKRLKQDVSIEAVAAGDYASGANSGKFTTFIVTFNTNSKISSLLNSSYLLSFTSKIGPKQCSPILNFFISFAFIYFFNAC